MLTVSLENVYKILIAQWNSSYSYSDYEKWQGKGQSFFFFFFFHLGLNTLINNHKEINAQPNENLWGEIENCAN